MPTSTSGVNTFGQPISQAGGSIVPTTPTYTAPSSITSSSLQPTTPISVTQPTQTPVYNTSNLSLPASVTTPPLTETPEQSQQSDLSKQLEALTTQDAGKAAFTTTQEQNAGIPGLQQTQTDLGTQLKTLQDQAKAIPLQDQNNATGIAGTMAGVTSLDTIGLRNNAIQSLAVSAQIDATNGLLSSAQQKVTEAVNQQYGPIEANITALQSNLKTIQNDPQSTIDEKNQASTQLDNVNAQKDQIAQQKADQTTIYNTANSAAANTANFNATTDYPTAATAISAISQAKTPADALNIAVATGLTENTTATADNTLLTPAEAKTLGVPYGTTRGQAAQQGIIPQTKTSGSGNTGGAIVDGNITTTPAMIEQGKQMLTQSASKGAEADGKYADPNVYLQMFQHWISQGGTTKGFLKQYPYDQYINPANTWLPDAMTAAHNSSSSSGGAQTP